MDRSASAVWNGSLKEGKGTISSQSGALKAMPYSFAARFAEGVGTNPEELIAASHAGCFSMALSVQLGNAGLTPERIDTAATVSFEKLEQGWTVTAVHLDVSAEVPGTDAVTFEKIANEAKVGCPISRLLNAKITMKATLLE